MGREIGGQKKYFKYPDLAGGELLVDGRYLRTYQGKYGVQWEFMDNSGEIVVLNSAGQLNWKMENYVVEGQLVKITYNGMQEVKNGKMAGKMCHDFLVEDMTEDEDSVVEGQVETPADGEQFGL